MSWPVKVLVVSSVAPKPTAFGEITLYRHLVNESKLLVEVVPGPDVSKAKKLFRRVRVGGLMVALETLREGRRWDARARIFARSFEPEVIFTEAAGDGYQAAIRLAADTGLPLVARFSDWWPDLVPGWVQGFEEVRFRQLHHAAKIALCVSTGMRKALGVHRDSRLLWPIPGKREEPPLSLPRQDGPNHVFRVLYSGNLREYASMLKGALQVHKQDPGIRLEVRGMSPQWPAGFRKEMARLGLYHEFAPREELERWLSSADAFLVTSAFEPGMRRLMETNFPSKLLEFARFGKPLVVWGPDYSTLIQWAQPGSRGLCITSPDPGELVNALRKLAASYTEQQRLAREASDAMKAEFDPAAIQQQFLQAIQDAVVGKIPRIRAATGNEPNSGVFQASLERVAPARVL